RTRSARHRAGLTPQPRPDLASPRNDADSFGDTHGAIPALPCDESGREIPTELGWQRLGVNVPADSEKAATGADNRSGSRLEAAYPHFVADVARLGAGASPARRVDAHVAPRGDADARITERAHQPFER